MQRLIKKTVCKNCHQCSEVVWEFRCDHCGKTSERLNPGTHGLVMVQNLMKGELCKECLVKVNELLDEFMKFNEHIHNHDFPFFGNTPIITRK